MRREIRLLPLIFLAVTLSTRAQVAPQPARGPDFPTRSFTPGIEVLSYTGLPFSGIDTLIITRPVAGGGTIVTSETSKVVRDSAGRVYRERHKLAPLGADPLKTIYEFYILDPVAQARTACVLQTRHCTVTSYYPRLAFNLMPVGPFDNGKEFLARDTLGQKTLDDLTVTGTRETTTISPGTLGNDQALTLTRDFWFSPDLRTNLSVTRVDPREGTAEIHLTVQSRDEPDPSIFAVPDGYTVHDTRQPAASLP